MDYQAVKMFIYHKIQQLQKAISFSMKKLQNDFQLFICASEGQKHSKMGQQINSQRIFRILEDKFMDEYDQNSIFAKDFFTSNLRKISDVIMNLVYNKNIAFMKIDQLVPFVSIIQHILHEESLGLPPSVIGKLNQYTHNIIALQNIQNMRNLFEDQHNSTYISDFYNSIYRKVFELRSTRIVMEYGLKMQNHQLLLYLLQCLIDQKDGNLQVYDTKVTADWIILSFVYFILAAKADIYKQKPVLERIIAKYRSFPQEFIVQRQIDGDELCSFYNNIVVKLLMKLNSKEAERLIDEIKTDIDVIGAFIVNPIQNQDNTVLDNIVFSSSWEM